jgi:hypothetical protein
VEIIDLVLLFNLQEDARITRGKGEEASSRGSTTKVRNKLENLT